ncbi:MAG: hypothetical protein WCW67_00265 [Candidatus Margulisiibacteriota bacterium]
MKNIILTVLGLVLLATLSWAAVEKPCQTDCGKKCVSAACLKKCAKVCQKTVCEGQQNCAKCGCPVSCQPK